jgi:hypothetical protein
MRSGVWTPVESTGLPKPEFAEGSQRIVGAQTFVFDDQS